MKGNYDLITAPEFHQNRLKIGATGGKCHSLPGCDTPSRQTLLVPHFFSDRAEIFFVDAQIDYATSLGTDF